LEDQITTVIEAMSHENDRRDRRPLRVGLAWVAGVFQPTARAGDPVSTRPSARNAARKPTKP